ncbi:DUF3997 domain-containing protein [Paenibacillus arenosi]|uniref:DUF3997 domain-containing protein n=1 Tax=Paenibacillus arenosi TaxID=2774142 RepID=A0ABR9B4B3_9BACL|nr:DUF3997 domain-containing protein [Paenibacillus arenosi]MBD8501227.1 DUF3997 domain-containing protein [Paenibacillus arenosi]
MKLLYLLMFLVTFSILQGCIGPGISDFEIKLSGGYSVLRTEPNRVIISLQEADDIFGSPVVGTKVVQVGWNEDYIVAKQVGLKLDPNATNEHMMILDDSRTNFYILDLNNKKKYGPLHETSYAEQRKKLKVPNDVILRNLDELR